MNKYIDILAPYAKRTFYPFQIRFLTDPARWRIANKSRQIGFSFTIAFDAISGALVRDRNQLIVSASKMNAEIVLDYVRLHLENLNIIPAVDKEGFMELPGKRFIRVCSTNWRTARGFNGDVYLDEFAFTIRDSAIWRAIVPSITAVNGRVTITSTPKSRIDKFWQIYSASSTKWSKHTVTIHQAHAEGFPVNIAELRSLFDPEEFAQAYECVPLDTAESYIPYSLIEPSLYDPDSFAHASFLSSIADFAFSYGVDIGRTKDETAIAETFPHASLTYCSKIFSWNKKTFREQKLLLADILASPATQIMAIDKGGIGMNLHEDLAFLYPSKVRGISFAPAVKERLAKNLKIMFENKSLRIPNDPSLISHILSIKRAPNKTNTFSYSSENSEHHGDKFWALALAADISASPKTVAMRFF